MVAALALREIESQSAEIIDQIDFIRDNAGMAPFAAERATLSELLDLITRSKEEFRDFADWHVPIYIGRCFIDELSGHWNIETQKRTAMFGKPYVDGFGNIGYENLYLPYLKLTKLADIKRIEGLRKQSRRATNYAKNSGRSSHRSQVRPRTGVRLSSGASNSGFFQASRCASRSTGLASPCIPETSTSN